MSRRLGENLVDSGHLTEAQLHRALTAHLVSGGHLGTTLLELGYIDERTLGETLGRMYGVPHTDFETLSKVSYSVIRALPVKLVEKHKVVPLTLEGKKLRLAMIDPKNLMAIDEISFVTGYHIESTVSPEVHILNALEIYYNIRRSQRYITLERELTRIRSLPRNATQIGEPVPEDGVRAQEAVVTASTGADARASSQNLPAPGGGRPGPDPWSKYGYGRSWREFADALDGDDEEGGEHADTRPQAVTRAAERPRQNDSAGPSLLEVSRRMADSQSVEDIVSTTLRYAADRLYRCMMFVVKGDQAIGWAGRGDGLNEGKMERLALQLPSMDRDSIFSVVQKDSSHYLGPVPTLRAFDRFFRDLGVRQPRFILLIPIVVKGRTTAYLYGDCGDSVSLPLDVPSMLTLCKHAGMALQIIILRNKILSVG